MKVILCIWMVITIVVTQGLSQGISFGSESKANAANEFFELITNDGDINRIKNNIQKLGNDNFYYDDGEYPLSLAIRYGRIDVVKLLIGNPANIKFTNKKNKWSPMHYAAQYGQDDIARLLNQEGANCEEKDINGNRPLHIAAQYGNEFTVETLMCFGANKVALNNDKLSPIHIAIKYGHFNCFSRLAWHYNKAEMNVIGAEGNTPLHFATIRCQENFVRLCIEEMALVDYKNNYGKTPRDLAKECDNQNIVNILNAQKGKNDGKSTRDLAQTCRNLDKRNMIKNLNVQEGKNCVCKHRLNKRSPDTSAQNNCDCDELNPTPTASTPTASTPTASNPTASTPTASTSTASTPTASTPTASTPTASTSTASTPTASTPTAPLSKFIDNCCIICIMMMFILMSVGFYGLWKYAQRPQPIMHRRLY